MKLRTVFKFLCIVAATSSTFAISNKAEYDKFYNQYISEQKHKIAHRHPHNNTTTALQQFTDQHFMLWDYLFKVDKNDMVPHFATLLQLCQNRKISRVIMFIPDPSFFEFFQPSNTSINSFVTQTNLLVHTMRETVPKFEMSVFFETGSFSSSANGDGTAPTVNPPPSPATPDTGYYAGLLNMLDWSKAMIAQVPGVGEIAFDPQGKDANNQQLVYNYSDEYKYLNDLSSIRIGTTVGIDESKEAYANTSTFPVNVIYTEHLGNFPANSSPSGYPSWRPGISASLCQSVYIQAYQTELSSIFAAGANTQTTTHNGPLAAIYFNKLLRSLPYVNGAGTISFSDSSNPASAVVTGVGTQFTQYTNLDLFATNTSTSALQKIGYVGTRPTSNLSLTLADISHAPFTESNTSFSRNEIATAWDTQPVLTQDMVDKIYWMFSANYTAPFDFFGNWELQDFMNFVTHFVINNNVEATAPFKSGGNALIFPSNNFVIYNYDFATTTVAGEGAPYNGVKIDWGLLNP